MPGLVVCIAGLTYFFLSEPRGVAGMSAWAYRQGRGGTGLFAPNNPRSIRFLLQRTPQFFLVFYFIQFAYRIHYLFIYLLILIQVFFRPLWYVQCSDRSGGKNI